MVIYQNGMIRLLIRKNHLPMSVNELVESGFLERLLSGGANVNNFQSIQLKGENYAPGTLLSYCKRGKPRSEY